MISKFLFWLTNYIPCRIIKHEGKSYLERYYLCPWFDKDSPFNVYIHRFVGPDPDLGLHDHPWDWAFSLLLSGGYVEEEFQVRTNRYYKVQAPGFNILRPEKFHRIVSCKRETWSLFFHGKKVRSWGFLVQDDVWGYPEMLNLELKWRPMPKEGTNAKTLPLGKDSERKPYGEMETD